MEVRRNSEGLEFWRHAVDVARERHGGIECWKCTAGMETWKRSRHGDMEAFEAWRHGSVRGMETWKRWRHGSVGDMEALETWKHSRRGDLVPHCTIHFDSAIGGIRQSWHSSKHSRVSA